LSANLSHFRPRICKPVLFFATIAGSFFLINVANENVRMAGMGADIFWNGQDKKGFAF